MKSKSILFVLIAAIALGSFTACSNGPTAPIYGSDVQGVTLVSAPDYLAGTAAKWLGIYDGLKTFDPADVTLNVIFNDGEKMQYNGDELNLKPETIGDTGTKDWFFVGPNVFTATFADGKKFNVNINAYTIEAIDVDLSGIKAATLPLKESSAYTADDLDLDGISLVVTYNGGTKRDVSAEILDSANVKAGFVETVKALVKADSKAEQTITIDSSNIKVVYNKTTYTLAQLRSYLNSIDGVEVNVTGSKTLTLADNAKKIIKAEAKQIVKEASDEIFVESKIADVNYEITFTYSDGTTETTETISKATAGTKFDVISHEDDWAFKKVGEEVKMLIKATLDGYDPVEVPLTVAARADYPTKFTVTANGTGADGKGEAKWGPKSNISVSQFTFAVPADGWASGNTYAEGEEPSWSKTDFTPNRTSFKLNAEAKEHYDIWFTYGGDVGLETVEKAEFESGITLVPQEEATVK